MRSSLHGHASMQEYTPSVCIMREAQTCIVGANRLMRALLLLLALSPLLQQCTLFTTAKTFLSIYFMPLLIHSFLHDKLVLS